MLSLAHRQVLIDRTLATSHIPLMTIVLIVDIDSNPLEAFSDGVQQAAIDARVDVGTT